jgi:ABC-type glycerol-3-phosphate transport system substrate-binding protein
MKKSLRVSSLILSLLMLLSAFALAACGNGTGGDTTTAAGQNGLPDSGGEPTEPAETEPQFSTAKYGGADWIVYMRSQTSNNYASYYVVPNEDASDIISQEAIKRNNMTEERFDINISAIETSSPYNSLRTDINGGEAIYDLILDQRRYLAPYGIDGMLVNLNSLQIDFTTHWWDGKAADQYSACGKLFVMPNDASVSNLGGVRFWYFNKQVLEDFKLTSPYDYAASNTWTLDVFYNMIRSVSAPNSDGTLGVYGLVNEENYTRNAAVVGSAVPWLSKVDEETFECRIATDYAEKTQNILDMLKTVVTDTSSCLSFEAAHKMDSEGAAAYQDMYAHCRGLFATDHFLFVMANMNCASEFTDMKKGFGVIMNPKFDSDQKDYYHRMDSNSIIFALPRFPGADSQKTIDIMDYWGYVSSSTSMEAYYELTLKTKRASDPTAAGVLDTIKGSIGYALSDIYANGTYNLPVGDFVSGAYSSNVSKAWTSYNRQINNGIKKLVAALQAME